MSEPTSPARIRAKLQQAIADEAGIYLLDRNEYFDLLVEADEYIAVLEKQRQQAEQEHERSMLQVIDERDAAQNAADKLAYAIADVDTIGEHSNLNDPWVNALDELAIIQDRAEAWEVLNRCRDLDQKKVAKLGAEVEAERSARQAAEQERDEWRRKSEQFCASFDREAQDRAVAEARVRALKTALRELRDYFAYATQRCTPSVWKEIKRQVEAALTASSTPTTEPCVVHAGADFSCVYLTRGCTEHPRLAAIPTPEKEGPHKMADCIDCRINQHIRRLAKETVPVFSADELKHLRTFGRAVARAVKRELERVAEDR